VSWYEDHLCREQQRVGGFEWHDEHSHFHYKDFASYELRRFRKNGTVDFTDNGLISISDKVSFCLMDSTPSEDDAFFLPFYLACTNAQQGISPGWADIYTSDLEGQSLRLGNLADGRYALVVTQDYANTIFETDNTNNRIVATVELADMGSEAPQATIVRRDWPAMDPDEDPGPGPEPDPEPEEPPRHDDNDSGLPDLVPVVTHVEAAQSFDLDPETNEPKPGPPTLYFDTQPQNLGSFPLELTVDDPVNAAESTVSQCIAWLADHVCGARRQVDGVVWSEEDGGFRLQDFALYSLRKLRRNGRVDFSSRGLVASVRKASSCIIDAEQVDSDASPVPFYTSCNRVRQGISPGWSDEYTSDLPGQQFDLDGVEDGRYAIVVDLDPLNRLAEFDDTRNRAVVVVELTHLTSTAPQAQIVQQSWLTLTRQRRG
jgi:hypothetical protein